LLSGSAQHTSIHHRGDVAEEKTHQGEEKMHHGGEKKRKIEKNGE
jgi:hypothetical protein